MGTQQFTTVTVLDCIFDGTQQFTTVAVLDYIFDGTQQFTTVAVLDYIFDGTQQFTTVAVLDYIFDGNSTVYYCSGLGLHVCFLYFAAPNNFELNDNIVSGIQFPPRTRNTQRAAFQNDANVLYRLLVRP